MRYGLYVITEEDPEGRWGHLDVATAAASGGAGIIQYRDKQSSARRQLAIAKDMRRLTWQAGKKLIINDRLDIALAAEADGVHLGQDDLPIADAKKLLPSGMIVGVSASNYGEALAASTSGADYIGVGPVFPTPSKADVAPVIGLEGLRRICQAVKTPVVAIGGLTVDNIGETLAAGVDGVAVISAVTGAENMAEAVRNILSLIRQRNKNADHH